MYLINRCNVLSLEEIEISIDESTDNIIDAYKSYLNDSNSIVEFGTNAFNGHFTLVIKNIRSDYHDYKYAKSLKTAKQARFEFRDKK